MAEQSDPPGRSGARTDPHHTARTQADKAARQERLAAEMRNNLLKRKRQQRARGGEPPARDG